MKIVQSGTRTADAALARIERNRDRSSRQQKSARAGSSSKFAETVTRQRRLPSRNSTESRSRPAKWSSRRRGQSSIDSALGAAIDLAIDRIERFHRPQLPSDLSFVGRRNGAVSPHPSAAASRHLRSRWQRGLSVDADHVRGAGADRGRRRARCRNDSFRCRATGVSRMLQTVGDQPDLSRGWCSGHRSDGTRHSHAGARRQDRWSRQFVRDRREEAAHRQGRHRHARRPDRAGADRRR